LGFTVLYTEASAAFVDYLTLENDSPVAIALRTRKPVFLQDVATYAGTFKRREIAQQYNIKSVIFQPVLGGVMEMGKSSKAQSLFGASDTTWDSMEAALSNKIPNAELEQAFRKKGATYALRDPNRLRANSTRSRQAATSPRILHARLTLASHHPMRGRYAIFWRRNFATGKYELAANYDAPANAINQRAGDKGLASYASESVAASPPIMGQGPVAIAGRAGCEVNIEDVGIFPGFARKDIAAKYGVGRLTLLPCETGVLEYGTVTIDKRTTTIGSEFQEASRPYRRDVFSGADWVTHRSTDAFQKRLATTFSSSILRARYKEVATVTALATLLCVYNGLVGGFTDFESVKQAPALPTLAQISLPLSVFSLTAGPLGLLLVFRTNACYARWDDARKIWGGTHS
jgi:hypothetical protein